MENAAKALLIAGGIAIALIIISLLVYSANKISAMGEINQKEAEVKQLAEFNAEYEAYNKKLMYGAEVLSVINKAEDNNIKYEESDYKIVIKVIDENNVEQIAVDSNKITSNSYLNKDLFNTFVGYHEADGTKVDGKKTNAYECTSITYSSKTGRVDSMTFKWLSYNEET